MPEMIRGFRPLSKFTENKEKAYWQAEQEYKAKYGRISRGFASMFGISKHRIKKLANYWLKDWPTIPQRATDGSAGYDLRANKTVRIPGTETNVNREVTLIPTGIKCYMPKDEVAYIYNRSSNPIKRGLVMPNGIGVIDSDYYNNPSNEGELCITLFNIRRRDYIVHRGDRIAQCVFSKYYKADNDHPIRRNRQGGFGSTGK